MKSALKTAILVGVMLFSVSLKALDINEIKVGAKYYVNHPITSSRLVTVNEIDKSKKIIRAMFDGGTEYWIPLDAFLPVDNKGYARFGLAHE